MTRTYNYPVYGTQGGGLVREVNGTYIFVEKPTCPGLDIGDEMPQEWSIVAANDLARRGEEFPFPSTSFEDERDGAAAFEKAPSRVDHMR